MIFILTFKFAQILKQIVVELFNFDDLPETAKKERLVQPVSILKFMAEVLRSYQSAAASAMIECTRDGQPLVRWLIEKFLLTVGVNDQSDQVHWTKAVLSELISTATSPSQRIIDQVPKPIIYRNYNRQFRFKLGFLFLIFFLRDVDC